MSRADAGRLGAEAKKAKREGAVRRYIADMTEIEAFYAGVRVGIEYARRQLLGLSTADLEPLVRGALRD
jgi:hypothetical protein